MRVKISFLLMIFCFDGYFFDVANVHFSVSMFACERRSLFDLLELTYVVVSWINNLFISKLIKKYLTCTRVLSYITTIEDFGQQFMKLKWALSTQKFGTLNTYDEVV